MNRRSLLKWLAALPFGGNLVKLIRRPMQWSIRMEHGYAVLDSSNKILATDLAKLANAKLAKSCKITSIDLRDRYGPYIRNYKPNDLGYIIIDKQLAECINYFHLGLNRFENSYSIGFGYKVFGYRTGEGYETA